MDGVYEMAKLLKERDNPVQYSPVIGTVEALPEIKVRINDKVVLGRENLKSTVDLLAQNADGEYIWQGKTVYLLPFMENNRIYEYLMIGGDAL